MKWQGGFYSYLPKDSDEMEARILSDNVILDDDFPLDDLPIVLGRSPEAGIRVADRWASRNHCEISKKDGVLCVRDLASTHGTLLNGQLITESALVPGDKLTVGLTSFMVCDKGHGWEANASVLTLVLYDATETTEKAPQIAGSVASRSPR